MKRLPTNRLRLFDETSPVDRPEVLESPTGRRSWPDDVKVRIVKESLVPGTRLRDVAERHGLTPQHLSTWRSQARKGKLSLHVAEEDLPVFARLEVAAEAAPISGTVIEIETGGVTVRLCPDTSATRIADIVAALRSAQ